MPSSTSITPEQALINYRERITQGKRTKMTSDERQTLIYCFVERLKGLEDEAAIKQLCDDEISLLEEGYPQNTIACDLLAQYRKAIANAIQEGDLPLTSHNSHSYTYTKRHSGEEEQVHEHYALTYLKYDPHTYQELRNQTTSVNNQRQDQLQPVNLYTYLQQIQKLLHSPDSDSDLDLKLAIAIAGATGRRHTEVLTKGSFTLTEHPYLLYFDGQQKKKQGEPTSFYILTILPASEVIEAIKRFRAIPSVAHLQGLHSANNQVKSFNVQVNRKVQALFQDSAIVPVIPGKKYVSLHRLRGVYGAITVHYFCPDSQHEHRFLQNYLGHTLSEQIAPNSSATPHYFHYYLVDGQDNRLGDKGIKLSEFPLPDDPQLLSSDLTSDNSDQAADDHIDSPGVIEASFTPDSLPDLELIPGGQGLASSLQQMLFSDSYTVIVAGLMAVTGRPPGELLKSGTFRRGDAPFTLCFSPTGLGATYPLKVLVDVDTVVSCLQRLRRHDDVQDLLYCTPNQINEHCLPYLSQAISHYLPFHDLDSVFQNYTQLTNNYTPISGTPPSSSEQLFAQLRAIAHRLDLDGSDHEIVDGLTQWVNDQLNSPSPSLEEILKPVSQRLHLQGSDDDLLHGLVQWVNDQLNSPPPSLDPVVAQTLSDQAHTLAWLTKRFESLENGHVGQSSLPHDGDQVALLQDQVTSLESENQRLKQELQQLQHTVTQLQDDNQQLQQLSERYEAAKQALLGQQLFLPLDSNSKSKSKSKSNSDTDTDTNSVSDTTYNKSGSKSPKKNTSRSNSAVERARDITQAILQWNQQHPHDSWAVNRGLLEKTFGVNRQAAGKFLQDYSSLVAQVNSVGHVTNPRSHNRTKDPSLLVSFVDTFISRSSN